jgi:lysophospholipase L1-like esterase
LSTSSFDWPRAASQAAAATPTARWRRWARALLLALIALATMELAARLDDHLRHGAPMVGRYDFDGLFMFDGRVVRGIPNARYEHFQLNSLGLRGPEPRLVPGERRVMLYGASELFGIYESPGHDLAPQLEILLNRSGAKVEVLNAAIPGMRVGSGALYLQELGERLHPDVVLIYPTPTHYIGVTHPQCGRAPRAPLGPDDGTFSSRLAAKAVDRVKALLPQPVMTLARRTAIALKHEKAMDRVGDDSLAAFRTDLECAIHAVRAIGAQPVLMTHANRFGSVVQADTDYWLTGWRMQYPELAEGGFVDLERRSNEIVKDEAETQHLPLVDAAAALDGRTALFADHAHFTDAGAAAMARLVAATLGSDTALLASKNPS